MIKQATIEDTSVIEEILFDAIEWMRRNKLDNLWNEQNSSWQSLSKQYKINQFYICYVDGKPAGCVAITDYDKKYWPDLKTKEALFIHKLAVKREFAGNGVSTQLIEYAKKMAENQNIKDVRLDCNRDRKKLRSLYEKQGFKYFKEVSTSAGYGLALYICPLK